MLKRRSIRLKGYDYSQQGAYFVTICTYNKKHLFGDVVNGKVVLSKFGEIARTEWLKTAEIRPNIEMDRFVVMPNHLHGIIFIREKPERRRRGTVHRAPTPTEQFGKPTANSIPTIIRSFKATVTKQINVIRHTPAQPIWQRNYFEHVIRGRHELNRIREYIIYNPRKWDEDKSNPRNWNKLDAR